jgi:transglutaminase-like putative cysteine protease
MPVFKIQHITKYKYDRPVRESANQIKIFSFNKPGQEILSHEVVITDEPSINKFTDYWSNTVGFFTVSKPHEELIIDSRLIAKTTLQQIDETRSTKKDWEILQQETNSNMILLDLAQKENLKSPEKIQLILDHIYNEAYSPLETTKKCSQFIFENFKYVKGITNVETKVDEILEFRSGVCQDFAHVLLTAVANCWHTQPICKRLYLSE